MISAVQATNRDIDTVREINLVGEESATIDNFSFVDLTPEELTSLSRLVEIIPVPGRRMIILRRNRQHRIGRVRLRELVITVPPPMPADIFVDLYLYASGADLSSFTERRTASIDLGYPLRADVFLQLLAYLLVGATERLLTRHIARTYSRREEKSQLIRGRPMWARDFGCHPVTGISYECHTLLNDNLLNRLVLAGLQASARILSNTPWVSHCYSQVFIWRSVAEEVAPRPSDFDVADRQINRLTEHYRPVLNLCRAVILGQTPVDLFAGSSAALQVLEFSLPMLFEKFLFRVLQKISEPLGLQVQFKEVDTSALLDGFGDTYREIEPDIVMFKGEEPVAVLDAKYKPRYAQGLKDDPLPRLNRVSNSDIYQLFFYQTRLQNAHGLSRPPQAAIVVPRFPEDSPKVDIGRRTVIWRSEENEDVALRVFTLPVVSILRSLKGGQNEFEALTSDGELLEALRNWSQTGLDTKT